LAIARVVARKLRHFLRRPRFERFCFVPAWLLLGVSRALILSIPLRKLAPWLGVSVSDREHFAQLTERQKYHALHIGRAVRWAACYTPWDSNCFAQALSARLLLGLFRVPYVIFFGAARDADGVALVAHAWVTAADIRVTGGPGSERFTVVGCFVASQLLAS